MPSGIPASDRFLRGDDRWEPVDWALISGKPDVFPTGPHTHSPQDITSGGAQIGQTLFWNGSNWVPGNVTTSPPAQSTLFTIVIVDGANPLVVGNDLSDNRYILPIPIGKRLRLLEWVGYLKVGGSATVRVLYSQDGGTTWQVVIGSASVSPSQYYGTSFAVQYLPRLALLRYDLLSSMNAGGLTFIIRGELEDV